MSVIVSEINTIGYLIIKWYLICYINIYLISSLLAAASWPNHPNYRPSSEIISSRMYLKSLAASSHWMIQELPPCLMKRGFWEKNGEIVCSLCWSCFPCYTHQPEPTHQYWLVTAPSVVWIEGWALYKQWKYIAGPGIQPETTITLIMSSTTELPRRKSIHGPII